MVLSNMCNTHGFGNDEIKPWDLELNMEPLGLGVKSNLECYNHAHRCARSLMILILINISNNQDLDITKYMQKPDVQCRGCLGKKQILIKLDLCFYIHQM